MSLIKQNKQTNKKRQPHIIQVNKTQERPFGCRSSFHTQSKESIYHKIGFYIVLLLFKYYIHVEKVIFYAKKSMV